MPGRNPADAIRAYTEPLQRAVSCLPGSGKIVLFTSKVTKPGDESAWILNGEEGLHIPRLGVLEARQHFRLVNTDQSRFGRSVGKFRVTTLSYLYSLRLGSDHEICWHWHPTGEGDEQRPHMHLSFAGPGHLPCARHTFEDIIESCIELSGGVAACDDWRTRLDQSRSVHTEHRSWVDWQGAPAALVKEIVEGLKPVAQEAQRRLKRSSR